MRRVKRGALAALAGVGLVALFLVTRSAPSACVASNGSWQSFPFTSQSGAFTFDADLTPLAQGLDSLLCLSKGAPTGVTSCAVILRFATDNQIDARDGGAYADLDGPGGLPYVAGELYEATLFVDVPAKTFEVAIGGVMVSGHPFSFRTEQANVASLDTWSVRRITGTGSHETCGAVVNKPPATTSECDPCAVLNAAPAACATWTAASPVQLAKADGWAILARETGGEWVPVIQRPWVKYQAGGKTVCAGYGFTPAGDPPAGCDKMLVLPHAPLTRWWTPTPGKLYDVTFRLYSDEGGYVEGPLVQNVEPMASDCGGEGHRWETICGPRLWPSGKCP